MKKLLIITTAVAAFSAPAFADTLANYTSLNNRTYASVNRASKSDIASVSLFEQGVITPSNYRSKKRFTPAGSSSHRYLYKSRGQGAADKP